MVRKSGYRFSDKIMLKSKNQNVMAIRRSVITPYRQRVAARTGQSFSALDSENSTRTSRVGLSGAR